MNGALAMLLCLCLPAWGQEPSVLQLKVIQGEGAVYAAGSRATRGLVVEITDQTGRPVEGASVTFRLPDQGPTGVFNSGAKTETVTTDADGRAEAWGMQWGREVGAFEMRITAAKGAVRGGVVASLYLSEAAVLSGMPKDAAPEPKVGGGKKKIWIAVGLAAAASVAVIGVAGSKPPGAAAPPAVTGGPQIGTPTITLGRP